MEKSFLSSAVGGSILRLRTFEVPRRLRFLIETLRHSTLTLFFLAPCLAIAGAAAVPDRPETVILQMSGGPVPGTGEAGTGIPKRATWRSFGMPALLNDGTAIGFTATINTPKGSLRGIFGGPQSAEELRLSVGSSWVLWPIFQTVVIWRINHDMVIGDKVVALRQPVFAPERDGEIFAVEADLIRYTWGEPGAVWRALLAIADPEQRPRYVASEGGRAPDASGGSTTESIGKFLAFTSVAMPQADAVWFTASLQQGVKNVTAANDTGVWLWQPDVGTRLMFREGSPLTSDRSVSVSKFKFLTHVEGSPGHARYGAGFLGAHVTLADGTESILYLEAGTGRIESELQTGLHVEGDLPILEFGVPNWRNTTEAVVRATLAPGPGVTEADDTVILDGLQIAAREGQQTGLDDGSAFANFEEPVAGTIADGTAVSAFNAKITRGSTGDGSDESLWLYTPGDSRLELIAREGAEAPEAAGTFFKSFTSLAMINARGPVFAATLSKTKGIVDSAEDAGVWALDSAGAVRSLFREGDRIGGKVVQSFAVLRRISGSPAQGRSVHDGKPAIVWRAHFDDGASAIVMTIVP